MNDQEALRVLNLAAEAIRVLAAIDEIAGNWNAKDGQAQAAELTETFFRLNRLNTKEWAGVWPATQERILLTGSADK